MCVEVSALLRPSPRETPTVSTTASAVPPCDHQLIGTIDFDLRISIVCGRIITAASASPLGHLGRALGDCSDDHFQSAFWRCPTLQSRPSAPELVLRCLKGAGRSHRQAPGQVDLDVPDPDAGCSIDGVAEMWGRRGGRPTATPCRPRQLGEQRGRPDSTTNRPARFLLKDESYGGESGAVVGGVVWPAGGP